MTVEKTSLTRRLAAATAATIFSLTLSSDTPAGAQTHEPEQQTIVAQDGVLNTVKVSFLNLKDKTSTFVLAMASRFSQQAIVIVSNGDDSLTDACRSIADEFARGGAPIKAVIRGPADGTNTASVYFNGRQYDNTGDQARLRASLKNGIDKKLFAAADDNTRPPGEGTLLAATNLGFSPE